MTLHNYKFDSIDELLAVEHMPTKLEKNLEQNGRGSELGSWCCHDRKPQNPKAVFQNIRKPLFPAGVARIEAMASRVSAPAPRSRRRKSYQSDQGDELDLQRVWQGDLEHAWRNTRREMSIGPSRVLIVINACAHSGMSSTDLARRGTTALALSTALQSAGYAVGVQAVYHTTICDVASTPYHAEVTLQEPGYEADIHKLASLVASGLLLRGVFLDHIYRVSELPVQYGTSKGMTKINLDMLNTVGYDKVIVVRPEDTASETTASNWLSEQIEELQNV